MMPQIVLFSIGGLSVSVRSLLMLASLSLFAFAAMHNAKRKGLKPEKTARALICGLSGMVLLWKLGYFAAEKNAVKNVLSSGEMSFWGFLGFFAGLRLYCLKSAKAFKRLFRVTAPAFVPFAAACCLLRDGAAGLPAFLGALFSYSDAYGLSHWNAPLLQGTLIFLLLAAAYLLKRFLKKPTFKISALPLMTVALSLIVPFELMRDTSYRRWLGIPLEAFTMWITLLALYAACALKRLKSEQKPTGAFLSVRLYGLVSILLGGFALRGTHAILAVLLITLPVLAALSPLDACLHLKGRRKARKRRFS